MAPPIRTAEDAGGEVAGPPVDADGGGRGFLCMELHGRRSSWTLATGPPALGAAGGNPELQWQLPWAGWCLACLRLPSGSQLRSSGDLFVAQPARRGCGDGALGHAFRPPKVSIEKAWQGGSGEITAKQQRPPCCEASEEDWRDWRAVLAVFSDSFCKGLARPQERCGPVEASRFRDAGASPRAGIGDGESSGSGSGSGSEAGAKQARVSRAQEVRSPPGGAQPRGPW
mmetsp:Transcript_137423/g.325497  ORF Transcript_137423/g.325497 Transcript_137423/m.325497 type:complete len:228 (+) Transcript_137423:1075-1758(+)